MRGGEPRIEVPNKSPGVIFIEDCGLVLAERRSR